MAGIARVPSINAQLLLLTLNYLLFSVYDLPITTYYSPE